MAKLNKLQLLLLANLENKFDGMIVKLEKGTTPKKEKKLRNKFVNVYLKSEAQYFDDKGNEINRQWIMKQPIKDVMDFIKRFFRDITEDLG